MRVARNILALLVNQVGTWSVTLVLALVVPPYLGAARYGLFTFVSSYASLFALGMSLGTGTYLTWRIAREPEMAGRLTLNTLLLQLPLALVSSLAALIVLPLLDRDRLVLELAVIVLVSTTLSALTNTCVAALGGFQIMRVPAQLALAASALTAALMIAGVILHADLPFLATTGLIGQGFGLAVNLIYVQRKMSMRLRPDVRLWPIIVRGGLPFFAWSAALLVYGQIDISMLKVMVGDAEVGWYALAYRIISIPIFLPTIVVGAMLPALASERDPASPRFRELTSRCIRLVAVVGIPACAGTVMLAGSIMRLLHYPASFNQASPLVAILALHMPVVALDMVLGTVLIAVGRQNAWTAVGIIAAIFNPLVNLWAIPYTQHLYGNGAMGASAVTVVTELLMLVGALILRPRTVFTGSDAFYILRCVVAAGVMVPAVWGLASQTWIGVVPAVGYGILIYAMAAYTLQIVSNDDLKGLAEVAAGKMGLGDLSQVATAIRSGLALRVAATLRGVRATLASASIPALRRVEAATEPSGTGPLRALSHLIGAFLGPRIGRPATTDARSLQPQPMREAPQATVEVSVLATTNGAGYRTPPQHAYREVTAAVEREPALASVGTASRTSERPSGDALTRDANGYYPGNNHHGRQSMQGTQTPVVPPQADPVSPARVSSTTPPISVVICTRDRPETIARAVRSVASQPYDNFDVLVVDQSHSNETQQIVQALVPDYPRVRYLHLSEAGLSRAYNTGMRHSRGEILAFTDDDCVAPATWLATIAQAFAAEPDVQLIYGQVLLPEELRAVENVDGVTPMLPIRQRRRLSRHDGFEVFGMGANFAARRTIFDQIGGFDEVLGGGGPLKSSQDFDFAYRVFHHGGTILLEPDVVVYHYGFRTHAEWPATLKAYGVGDGGFYFKHVRAGDPYAALLLARVLSRSVAREVKHLVRSGPRAMQWEYARNLLVGMRGSLKFGVDRQRRLYYARQRG